MASSVNFGNVLQLSGDRLGHGLEFNAFNLSNALEFLDLLQDLAGNVRVDVHHGNRFAGLALAADLHGGNIDFIFTQDGPDIADHAGLVDIGVDHHGSFRDDV